MKEKLGVSIARYRKENKMTQEELAKQLNISYQAVSKWENGQTLPDVETLSRIAEIMHVSMDALAGFPHHYHATGHYEMQYRKEEYFWGVNPSGMCLKILGLMPPNKPLKFLDICCGEGKDAVFMVRCGYQVSAFDISDAGIEKTKKLASTLSIMVLTADVIHKVNQIRIWYEMTPESDLRGVLKLLEEYPKVCVNFQIVGFFRLFYETSLPSKISSISRAVTIKGCTGKCFRLPVTK